MARVRDNPECQECGATIGLQVHHPDEARPFDVELFVTLCARCHAEQTRGGAFA
jgi:cytochrome c553